MNLILESTKGFKLFFDSKYLELDKVGHLGVQTNDKGEYHCSILHYTDPDRPSKLKPAEQASLKLYLSKEGHDRVVEAVARVKGNTIDTTTQSPLPTVPVRSELIRNIRIEEAEQPAAGNQENGTQAS